MTSQDDIQQILNWQAEMLEPLANRVITNRGSQNDRETAAQDLARRALLLLACLRVAAQLKEREQATQTVAIQSSEAVVRAAQEWLAAAESSGTFDGDCYGDECETLARAIRTLEPEELNRPSPGVSAVQADGKVER